MSERARELYRAGRRAEALKLARAECDPGKPADALLIGAMAATTGEVGEGERLLTFALEAGEGQAQHWRLLAAARADLGDKPGELAALDRAVRMAEANPDYRLHYALVLLEAGRREQALDQAIAALKLRDDPEARRIFVATLHPGRTDAEHRGLVKRALAEWWARSGAVTEAATHLVLSGAGPVEDDDLAREMLVSAPLRDLRLERRFTEVRRRILREGGDADLIARLARQGDINEFCWFVSDEEAAALAKLPPDDPRRAMYEAPPEPVRTDIPVLTPIQAGVSETVREMYEANPYPRWVRLAQQAPEPQERALQAMFPRTRIEPLPGREILVAGCGTGQHALEVARRYEGCQVLAVDLSLASLSYAKTKAEQYGVRNVEFGQADLLELARLGRTFAAVECVGTLHHLEDPFAGFRVLAGLVKPGGVMRLGLYSRRARAELEPAKALSRGFEPTPEGIRALRRAIIDAPPEDPVRAALRWGDFYTLSECRDLLLHVQEHQSDIADIRRMLDMSGFRFLGFSLPPQVSAAYRGANPQDPSGQDLDRWDAFEAARPDTFRGMYQFWMQKPA